MKKTKQNKTCFGAARKLRSQASKLTLASSSGLVTVKESMHLKHRVIRWQQAKNTVLFFEGTPRADLYGAKGATAPSFDCKIMQMQLILALYQPLDPLFLPI